jgi:predicted RNase H-like HicB family nuclease
MKYPIIFTDKLEGYYQIDVPDLPGCSGTSDDLDDGFNVIKLAIENHLTILAEYGESIPNAKSITHYQEKYSHVIWAIVDIDITPYLGKSHKINVTLPELLIKQIDDRVNKSDQYKTRSGFIASACLKELTI